MKEEKKGPGAPRKWNYEGKKKTLGIRLSDSEKAIILAKYPSIAAFIQDALARLKGW